MFVLYLAIALVLLGVVFLVASVEVRPVARKSRPRSMRYEEYHDYPLPPTEKPVIAPPVMNEQQTSMGVVAKQSGDRTRRAEVESQRDFETPEAQKNVISEQNSLANSSVEQAQRFEDVEARSRLEDDDLLCFEESEESCSKSSGDDDAFMYPESMTGDESSNDSSADQRVVRAVLFEDKEGAVSVKNRAGEPEVDSFNRLRRVGKGELFVADEYLSFHAERMMYRYDFRRMQSIEAGEHSFIVRPLGNDCPLLFLVEGSGAIIDLVLERFNAFRS